MNMKKSGIKVFTCESKMGKVRVVLSQPHRVLTLCSVKHLKFKMCNTFEFSLEDTDLTVWKSHILTRGLGVGDVA